MCPYTTFDNSSRYGKLDHEAMLCQIRAYLDAGGPWPGHTRAGVRGGQARRVRKAPGDRLGAGEVSGQVPLAVTVYGHTVEQQIRFAGLAQSRGADWLILQPPPVKGLSEADWLDLYVNTEDQK